MGQLLAKRDYRKDLMNFGINKAKTSKLGDLRGSKAPANTDNVPTAVSTFKPNNPYIYSLLKTGMELLKGSPRMKTILKRLKFIHSRRQPPHLQQLLVRSKFSDNQNITVSKCGGKKLHNVQTNHRGELVQLQGKRVTFQSERQYGLQ